MRYTKIPICFELAHSLNCHTVTIIFGPIEGVKDDGTRLVFTLMELSAVVNALRTHTVPACYVSDIGRDALIRTDSIVILRTQEDTNEGEVKVKAFRYMVDSVRLLSAAINLHQRSLAAAQDVVEAQSGEKLTINDIKPFRSSTRIERFRLPVIPFGIPLLSAVEMVRHPNTRAGFTQTLAHFMRHLNPRARVMLRHTLSSYLPRAIISGSHPEEFYFDGRGNKSFGMNGGIILRADDYSTHT